MRDEDIDTSEIPEVGEGFFQRAWGRAPDGTEIEPWYCREIGRWLDDGTETPHTKEAARIMLDTCRVLDRPKRDETATTHPESTRKVQWKSNSYKVAYPATFWELVRYAITGKPYLRLAIEINMDASSGAAISNIVTLLDVVDEDEPT